MTIDEVLNDLLYNYDIIKTKLALLEIIKGVKIKKYLIDEMPNSKSDDYLDNLMEAKNKTEGFNQGVEAYEKAIEEMFK